MTDTVEAILTEQDNDTAAAIAAGRATVTPKPLSPSNSRFFVQPNPVSGESEIIDTTELKHDFDVDHPFAARKTGQHTAFDADSLIAYVQRHGEPGTELWADVESRKILAIVNGDTKDDGGWADHRITLQLRHTPEWNTWISGQGLTDQVTFAEHIETRGIDIVEPTAATLLELAQTFQATKSADFESSKHLTSGQTTLEYRETLNATAGKKGEIDIPNTFTVALAPFRGEPKFRVTARLRYRVGDGHLAIGYYLDNPDDVIEAAFDEIATEVRQGLADYPVVNGSHSQ